MYDCIVIGHNGRNSTFIFHIMNDWIYQALPASSVFGGIWWYLVLLDFENAWHFSLSISFLLRAVMLKIVTNVP